MHLALTKKWENLKFYQTFQNFDETQLFEWSYIRNLYPPPRSQFDDVQEKIDLWVAP